MTKPTALSAFMARKAEIDAMLSRLKAMSGDHFDISPDAVDWGHVGDLGRIADLLRQAIGSDGIADTCPHCAEPVDPAACESTWQQWRCYACGAWNDREVRP